MQKSRETSKPHMSIKFIEDSKIPLGEDEARLHSIKEGIERDVHLSNEDETFLSKLVEKAKEWQRGTKSSEDTDPADTMPG